MANLTTADVSATPIMLYSTL